jgi:hypothetical protein
MTFYFPLDDPLLLEEEDLLTEDARLVEERRPNPPDFIWLEGFLAWKLFWEAVGFFKGALIFEAVLPWFGELTAERIVREEPDV